MTLQYSLSSHCKQTSLVLFGNAHIRLGQTEKKYTKDTMQLYWHYRTDKSVIFIYKTCKFSDGNYNVWFVKTEPEEVLSQKDVTKLAYTRFSFF